MLKEQTALVPFDLQDALKWFVEVMYYRFEFARGMAWEGDALRPEEMKKMFPWTWTRTKFFAEPGKPIYLDDIRTDIRRAGKNKKLAIEYLKHFVELTRCPLFNYDKVGILWKPHCDTYFPDVKEVGNRLREYCDQLIALQSYLINEIGVRQGALFPVWIENEVDKLNPFDADLGKEFTDSPYPSIGVIPENLDITNILISFIAWEHGGDGHVARQPGHTYPKGFYYRALRWGRVECFRLFRIQYGSDITSDQSEILSQKRSKTTKTDIINNLSEGSWLKDLPLNFSDEIRLTLREYPELGVLNIRELKAKEVGQVQLIPKEPTRLRETKITSLLAEGKFCSGVKLAANIGRELYQGGYRDFWNL
jgi:hypothetical protein